MRFLLKHRGITMAISNSKPPTETELIPCLRNGEFALPPASLQLIEDNALEISRGEFRPDGFLEACWQGQKERFVFEYKALSTPKAIETAISQAVRYGEITGLPALVIIPYLSEERLRRLEAEHVSGIDLCGNGVLMASHFSLWRSGGPNRFKDTQAIKNVFRGTSSLYARCFLLRSEFTSLVQLRNFALSRSVADLSLSYKSGRLVKSTASKVVQALEEEQILYREGEASQQSLRLVNVKRLLDMLQKNYMPSSRRSLEGKTPLSASEIWQRLSQSSTKETLNSVVTGLGSAAHYGALSGPGQISLYVSHLDTAGELLEVEQTRVFPNIQLIEERSDTVYFDARSDGQVRWASPIQTWLELATGGPREQDASRMLETKLASGRAEDLK